MSRFFIRGDSSSEDEESDIEKSGEQSEEGSDEEKQTKIPSRFLKSASDDEEEERKRVVRSAKDKRFDELHETQARLKQARSIDDWNKIQQEFDKLNKQIINPKLQEILQKENMRVPKLYIRELASLEQFVAQTQANKPKGMHAAKARAFNAMRQRMKKVVKEYEQELEHFKEHPRDYDTDEEGEEDDKLFDELDDEAESPDDEPSDVGREEPRNKWFISDKVKEPTQKPAKPTKPTDGPARVVVHEEVKENEEKKKPTEMTYEEVRKKLKEILDARGKRSTDPSKQVERLTDLFPFAKEADLQVEILIHLISAQFDLNRSTTSHLPTAIWKSAFDNLNKILDILEKNPSIKLQESEVEDTSETLLLDDEGEERELKQVGGNLVGFVQRLDDEFIKTLQITDPHIGDYINRLQDENSLLDIALRTQKYYEKQSNFSAAARIAMRRVEHTYYKLDSHLEKVEDRTSAAAEETKSDEAQTAETKSKSVDGRVALEELASLIFNHGDERMKTRFMLCQIYHHSLHDRFYEARDLMLMSHLQESVTHMDPVTQVLFNRTTAQLGLCAFRCNLLKQAHSCLSELYSGGRIRELLAQGVTSTRYGERSVEQEKLRQLPFHMHINLDLLDSVHLICAMLLEIPYMAANTFDTKKSPISKAYRKLMDAYEKQAFTGPPESTRDIVVVAGKALAQGDWKTCEELVLGLQMWNLMHKSDQVKAIVRRKIQEEGLRTYIFTYSSYYDSMSLESLSSMFELAKNIVHSIVSKMMISEELHASWDQPTGSIILHKVEPTKLQGLALQFADKAATFVENNERMLDTHVGIYKFERDAKIPQKDGQRRGQRDQRDNRDNRSGKDRFYPASRDRERGDQRRGYNQSRNRF